MAVNTVQYFKHAYPENQPFEKSLIIKFLEEVVSKKINANIRGA